MLMSIYPLLLAPPCLLLGSLLILYVFFICLKKGRISGRFRGLIYKKDHPTTFWAGVIIYSIMGIVTIIIGIYLLYYYFLYSSY